MEIEQAFFASIGDAFPSLPIAYPGVNFTPPAAGQWIEVAVFRAPEANQPLGNGRGVEQGTLQIVACTRAGLGTASLLPLVLQIRSAYPKGRAFASGHRIVDNANVMSPQIEGDRLMLPVSMSYSA